MIKKRIAGLVVAGASVAGVLALAGPAEAAEKTVSCSADGQTATIRITHTADRLTIQRIEYKITDNGRNQGNIWVNDYAVVPTRTTSTASAIQDGKWHVLREANYGRGGGGMDFKVTFDQPWNDDSCGKVIW